MLKERPDAGRLAEIFVVQQPCIAPMTGGHARQQDEISDAVVLRKQGKRSHTQLVFVTATVRG